MARRRVTRSHPGEHFTQWTIVLNDGKSYIIRYYPTPDDYTGQWVVMTQSVGAFAEGSSTYKEVMEAFRAWRSRGAVTPH